MVKIINNSILLRNIFVFFGGSPETKGKIDKLSHFTLYLKMKVIPEILSISNYSNL